jgi:predicted nucleotidyltransferase component of viral defense system
VIPHDDITEWRARTPWAQDIQVEQDLVISRASVEIFSQSTLAEALAFRGGTVFYKLHLTPAARYSEDIDPVQKRAEQAGTVMSALRAVLDPCLGEPRWKQSEDLVTNTDFSLGEVV